MSAQNNLNAMEETASQHYTIGDNLRHKAFYDDAIDEFQKALHIQEPLLGEDSPAVAKTHYALGLALRATKDYKQALYHLNTATCAFEVLRQKEKKEAGSVSGSGSGSGSGSLAGDVYRPESSDKAHSYQTDLLNCKLNIARTHHSQGVDFQRSGDYDRSIADHRKALAIRENLLGRSNLETARTYYVVGCALSDRGDFDEALAELRRALRARLLIFGKEHLDVSEVVANMGTVLMAKGSLTTTAVATYKGIILQSLDHENEGDALCRKGDYETGMICYRKALSLEEQSLGDLHPTTCDLYLRMADALGQIGELEASLIEYKSAISIYERLLGKFHVKVANIYNKLAGILLDKGEYETALSFYAKAYGIYDSTLGNHDDTKQALMNIRLAAAKERTAKESMDMIKKAEEDHDHNIARNIATEKEINDGNGNDIDKEAKTETKEETPADAADVI
jgi:tetratricopeptide (TPR) repeat protein